MDSPQQAEKRNQRSEFLSGLATREKGVQLALLIPTGILAGWLLGVGLDHWRHTHWIAIAGVIVGAVAGFAQMIRLAMRMMK